MASTISKNKKNYEAAVKALDVAESYFNHHNLDSAIKEALQAKKLDPKLPNVDNFITAYKIHRAVSTRKSWYVVLGIPECTDSKAINKKYKELALVVHPDKNGSAAADGAFRHVKAALDFLSDPAKKKAYDLSLRSTDRVRAAAAARKAAEAKNAAAAAAKEAEAAAARNEINARKRPRSGEPMSALEYDISLLLKYSSKHMARKFYVC